MRIGQNPAKMRGSPAYSPKRVGLASLTYVPDLEGYFRQAREVIFVHLTSLRQSLVVKNTAHEDCDLCVFDNGSCPEIVRFLQEQWQSGLIDWLFLSHHNLGKNGALNWIFGALPNEFIGYSDSDVFFRPGWLEKTLSIFAAFPKAGMVSAQPVFFDFLRGQGKTSQAIQLYGPGFHIEDFHPRPEILDEYCEGINATPDQRQQFQKARLLAAVQEAGRLRAVTSATDMQFILRRDVARQLVPLPIAGALTARDAIAIPQGIEDLGYWILSSDEPLVRHMGNTVLGRGIPEIETILEQSTKVQDPKSIILQRQRLAPRPVSFKSTMRSTLQHWLDRSPRIRRVVTRLYDNLFSLLYEERQEGRTK